MIEELFRELAQLPNIEAIALGGSRAGEHFDPSSDYDVYLYCTAPVPEPTRRAILSRYCRVMELGNRFWEYEDNCTLNDGVDIDLLYRNLDDFAADVALVVEQHQARNAYTTCMWHNLLTCRILYDRDGRLARLRRRFDVPYPQALRVNIVSRARRLLHGSLPAYDRQLAKAASRGDLVSVNHRAAAFLETYFDLLFALNRQTHPGEKRLMTLARQRCVLLPDRFEENLQALFAHLFAAPERIPADLQAIVQELDALLDGQMPQ